MGNNQIHAELLKLKSKIKDKSGWNAEKKIDWDALHNQLDEAIKRVENLNKDKAYKECGTKNSPFPHLPYLRDMVEEALKSENGLEQIDASLYRGYFRTQIKNRLGIKTMGDFRQTHQE